MGSIQLTWQCDLTETPDENALVVLLNCFLIVIVRGAVVRLSSRPIVDGLLIVVCHSIVVLLKLLTRPQRLSVQHDRDRQRRNSVDYFEVALTDLDSAS